MVTKEEPNVASALAPVEDDDVANFQVFTLDVGADFHPPPGKARVFLVHRVLVAHRYRAGIDEATTPREGGVVFPLGEDVPYHVDDDEVGGGAGDLALARVGEGVEEEELVGHGVILLSR